MLKVEFGLYLNAWQNLVMFKIFTEALLVKLPLSH